MEATSNATKVCMKTIDVKPIFREFAKHPSLLEFLTFIIFKLVFKMIVLAF